MTGKREVQIRRGLFLSFVLVGVFFGGVAASVGPHNTTPDDAQAFRVGVYFALVCWVGALLTVLIDWGTGDE